MNPFENKTPQQIAALYKRGTEYREFIRELVNSKCKEAGFDDDVANKFALGTGAIVAAIDTYDLDKLTGGLGKQQLLKELCLRFPFC